MSAFEPRRAAALAGALLVLLACTGCGDPALWARWCAQRELFRVAALEHRLEARGTTPESLDRIERRYAALLAAYPPEQWAPAKPDTSAAYEVAVAAGRAGLALAAAEARRGHFDAAASTLERLEPRVARVPGVLLESRLARHRALEALGRFEDSFVELTEIAAMDPLGDPWSAQPPTELLEAPLHLAAELRARGRDAEAAEALRITDAAFGAAFARARPEAREAMALGLAGVRAARGDAAGALVPLRSELLAAAPAVVPEWAEVMGAHALDAGAPDSALVYANWAIRASGARRIAGPALLVAARAWERLGRRDSAIAMYDVVLRRWPDPGPFGPPARFGRAEALEAIGQWDLANSEYLSLAAKFPTHPLALTSGLRIVAHHLATGQPELARISGESSLANLEQVLATNRDAEVQRLARAARAELLLDLGRLPEAEEALLDQWRRYPADSASQEAGMRAATLARHRPGGDVRADSILSALRRNAFSATVRREAAAGDAVPR